MQPRVVGVLGIVLAAAAATTAYAGRFDPLHDDDRLLTELAKHEYVVPTEALPPVPVVRCGEVGLEHHVSNGKEPPLHARASVVLGPGELRLDGREVLTFTGSPGDAIAARSSGDVLLPLEGELEYQRRIAIASGTTLSTLDLYLDGSLHFSTVRTLVASSALRPRLVVRDVETGRLRFLEVQQFRGLFCMRSEFTIHLIVDDRSVKSESGVEVLRFAGERVDATPLLDIRHKTIGSWDAVVHVTGDPSWNVVSAVLAALDHAGSGGFNDDVPIVLLDPRPSEEVQRDVFEADRRCPHPVFPPD